MWPTERRGEKRVVRGSLSTSGRARPALPWTAVLHSEGGSKETAWGPYLFRTCSLLCPTSPSPPTFWPGRLFPKRACPPTRSHSATGGNLSADRFTRLESPARVEQPPRLRQPQMSRPPRQRPAVPGERGRRVLSFLISNLQHHGSWHQVIYFETSQNGL